MLAPPLSLALSGLTPAPGEVGAPPADTRAQLAWARSLTLAAVQLDAAAADIRPRDLGRSARRELAALLRRTDLVCSGLDLWIPPEHFSDPANVDRAVAAVLGAIDLAADLAALGATRNRYCPISITLPPVPAAGVIATLCDRVERASTPIANHAWPIADPTSAPPSGRSFQVVSTSVRPEPDGAAESSSLPDFDMPSLLIGAGLDPATALTHSVDPAQLASRLGPRLASARLTDFSAAGVRVSPGAPGGRLDLLGYQIALATSDYSPQGGHVILDLRSLPDQRTAAARAISHWMRSA